MATILTNTTFSTTYRDDFKDSDNYHRILFNSGKALQARELTQIQTFLQSQISRFGNNIFKEGAVVKPGGANLNQKYEFIKLNTSATGNALDTDTSVYIGQIYTGASSTIKVKVLEVVPAVGSDPATLYVQYISSTGATGGVDTLRMTSGENMTGAGTALNKTLTVSSDASLTPHTGVGILATLKSGIYYARGNFVFTEDQSKIISKYSDNVNTDIGYKSIEDIVTISDDNELYDNQGAIPDTSSPGADRYRIRLTIAEKNEVNSDENFIHVATVKEGSIYNAISTNDAYNIPNQVIATRIKENSGDYTVKPFTINFGLDSANTHLQLRVSDGIVVVDGHRAARTSPTIIRIPKATSTTTLNNEAISADFGNFVFVNPADSDVKSGKTAAHGMPELLDELELRDSTSFHGSATDNKIGTARLKAITEDGSNFRYHLFDINMNAGKAFRNVRSIGKDSDNFFNPTLETNLAVLKGANNNTSIFALPRARPQTLTDTIVTVQRRFTATSSGGGAITVSLSASGETFTNTGDWVIMIDGENYGPLIATPVISGASTTAKTISGLPASKSIKVLAYVNKTAGIIKEKTLTTHQQNYALSTDALGGKFINLHKADLYEVEKICLASDSSSIADKFLIDHAQFPSHYGLSKLLLKPGAVAPSGNIIVKFKYFEHSPDGDFFAANSYAGKVDYNKIPSIRLPNGNVMHLRNALDFRSVMDSDGAFVNTSTGARPTQLPQPQQTIFSDITYYLRQSSKLVIDINGNLQYIEGIPGFNSQVPPKPEGTLPLYDISLGANTFNSRDVTSKKIEFKRFTMNDIGQLEKRINQIEELTSLSLLDLDTKNLQILDSAGNDRIKAGFVIDNFTSHNLTEASNLRHHRASIDAVQHRARPMFTEDNIKLIFDSANADGITKKGDNLYLDYTEALYINQDLATKAIVINPFAVAIHEGIFTVSPSSDEWRDVERVNDKTVPGGTQVSGVNGHNWDSWSWNWKGSTIENLGIGSMTNEISSMVNRVVAEESVLTVIDDKLVQSALIPYIRARKIFFKAEGLRPNTQHFAFFDGISVANYVKEEAFVTHADNPIDYGNTLFGKTVHPDGASLLTSDVNGTITGSFLIPNNGEAKFKTGSREFMLLDITAPNAEHASSLCKMLYIANGTLETRTGTVKSTRVLHIVGAEVVRTSAYVHSSDGGGHTVTTTSVVVPAGTNLYYANDAQDATSNPGNTNMAYSDFHTTSNPNVDDFSVTSHVTHDPEVFGVDNFGGVTMTTGQANTTTTTTFETNTDVTYTDTSNAINDLNNWNYESDDNSSHSNSSDPGGGSGGGSWT